MLKWLRSVDPVCPWDRILCRYVADLGHHHDVVRWIDEQPDSDSDLERSSESDWSE